MAERRRRGGSPDTWDGTWEGKILDVIYGYYKEALDALPLEEMPSLAPRLLGAGVCFGFADPVTNIIANTLSFVEPDGAERRKREPDGAERQKRKPDGAERQKRKRKRNTNASGEARLREEVLSKIVSGDGPSAPEARTVAERSLEGLLSFLASYFRYLPTWDALRYLSQARADLLVAVYLIQKDFCCRRKDQFQVCSPAVKTAFKCAAWSARQPNFSGFLASSFALVSHVNIFTETLSAQGRCRLTIKEISWLSRLLANPLELKKSNKPMKLVRNRFRDSGSNASTENVPGQLIESLRGILMDRVHGHYLKAISRFPMKDLQSHHHRGLLKAGYCFGPLDPVSNIIVNTIWYDIAFPPTKEFEVDMITTLRHIERRSVNGLIAFVRACFPVISEHQTMVYLLNSNLDVCKAIQMAKSRGCDDTLVCDDSGYKAAAKAASHPNPEAYCEFAMRSFSGVMSRVRCLLQGSDVLPSSNIFSLSALLSISTVESPEPLIELTEDAVRSITKYKEEFLSQQSLVRRKVEASLRSYEQSQGCHYDLGVICGLNDCVGEQTGFFDTKYQYTHINFWATQPDGSNTLFFAEFSNDEGDDYKPFCCLVSGQSTQVRCCYCEYHGIRIVHPVEDCWEGANGFQKIACGEMYFTNEEILSCAKRMNNQVEGIFIQDYIYLDPAQDAKLIQAVNHAEWVSNLNMDELLRIISVPPAEHYPLQV